MQYGITPVTANKAIFTHVGDNGEKLAEFQFNPQSLRGQQQVAAVLNLPLPEILSSIDQTYNAAVKVAKLFPIAPKPLPGHPFRIREFKASDVLYSDVQNLPGAVHDAIALHQGQDLVIEWKGKESFCCLDIDYHEAGVPAPPKDTTIANVLTGLYPAPDFWHLTRRGGVHAFYTARSGLTAEERAALGYLSWHLLDPTATCDLPTQVRPLPKDEVIRESYCQGSEADSVAGWLVGGSIGSGSEEVKDFLDERGWVIGGRYSHDVCPIDPTPGDAKNDPVEVTDRGVFCFRCQSKGLSYGRSRKTGYCSWTQLFGRVESTPIRNCVHHLTHWGHAQWVLRARTTIPDPLLALCYRGALKVYHNGRSTFPLIPLVFNRDTDWLVRGEGCWQTVEQGYQFPKDIVPLLATLPCCNRWDEEKSVAKPAASSVNLMQQPTLDLSDRGYQPIEVLKGMRMQADLSDEGRLVVTTPPSWSKKYGRDFQARYLPAPKRIPEEEAKALIASHLPGINWQYVYALLLARGANESKTGLHPFILVDGVSGAGKSTHVKIAASILGDYVSEVPMDASVEKFRSALRDSSKEGSFIVVDEFLKDATNANSKLSPEKVLDPILNLNEGSKSHKMYVGPSALGHLAVCVFTETRIPASLKDYTQIARRVHYMRLEEPVDWEQPLARLGVADPMAFRCCSLDVARACNSIASWVIDQYFGYHLTFEQLAAEIGVTTLQKSEAFEDLTPQLVELFRQVCLAGDPDEQDAKRFPGRGYKVIRRNDALNPELANIWSALVDNGGENWGSAKRVSEKSFKLVLGTEETVHVDICSGSGVVAIRFRQGAIKNPARVNQEIQTTKVKV